MISSFCLQAIAQEKVIRLYDWSAPGSEDWKQTEQENRTNLWQTRVVFNVANPTSGSKIHEKSYCTGPRSCYYPRPLSERPEVEFYQPLTDNRSLYGSTY
jgi:hypothetical protein